MPLLKEGEIVADPWVAVDDDADIPAAIPIIVSQERWLARANELAGRNAPIGIRLKSHQAPSTIADDLHRFSLVALEFPHFKDGRAYSYARILRERYGFEGEIRAVGNVLRDQHLFMIRCGFDAFEVRDGENPAEWRKHAEAFSVFYQPATDRRPTALELRHPQAAE